MGEGEDLSIADLVGLVVANPQKVGAEAAARLEAGRFADERERTQLHWIIGRAERESGNLETARHQLEQALTGAERAGDRELLIGVHSSLAFTLGRLGDLDGAEKLLAGAEVIADPLERARLMAQRGVLAYLRGELARGAEVVAAACEEMRRNGDLVHEARHRTNLGAVLIDLGRYGVARRHLARAVSVAETHGLDVIVAEAKAGLAHISTMQGDLPGAMQEFAEAERRHLAADTQSYLPRLHSDHARALADASLLEDASQLLDRALAMLRSQGQLTELPQTLVRAAEVRLARGDLDGAHRAATEAVELLTQQGRRHWLVLASSLALQIRARRDGVSAGLTAELERVADRLRDYGWLGESTRARLVAARLELDSAGGRPVTIDPALRRSLRLGRAADRILLAYIDARMAEQRGDRGAARRAVTHGLRVAVSAQAGLGAMETRAHAARHGYDLTELGARIALEDRRPRELLARIEATRLMSSRMPMLRPPEDDAMAAMLTALRGIEVRIADASTPTEQRVDDEQQRVVLERRLARRAQGVRGDTSVDLAAWEDQLGDAIAMLGPRTLVAFAAVHGRLHAVSVRRRRARLHDLGAVADVGRRLDGVAFALNRLNRVQGSDNARRAAEQMLAASAAELAAQLLPPGVVPGDDAVVIVPTARLHDIPWGLLPPLAGRPVSVDPSIASWATAERMRLDRLAIHGGGRAAGLVAGPGLEHAHGEIDTVRRLYESPIVLDERTSSVVRCLELVAQSDVVHFACHGAFRTDNPMFSSLRVADGPLVIYDFERLSRFPETVVLSACSAANARVLQGGSLLGLAAALITLGVANVVAPLTPISDASAAGVMAALHASMVAGATPAEALAATSVAAASDAERATAGAFVVLGA
ncbi:CHAT domain-containing protein [Desertimonas flava]|uniref:CHAT domain-containing protein n=1 Tax=Desertimonas flava TaxID=2064846 RepID=UPI000E351412|nr:CHAT domain-containing protein [Desertimonas flava]